MHIQHAFLVAATANVAQAVDWPLRKRQDYAYVTDTMEISSYVTSVETICTSTDTVYLPPETGTYDCPVTVTNSEPCTATITSDPTTSYMACPYTTTSSKYCQGVGDDCVVTYTATSTCSEVIPGSSSESEYYCYDTATSNTPCETVTTPTTISTSEYPCTTTVTSSTTIYKKITITDTRTLTDTLTVPSPTTTTDVVLVPTFITTTVTEDGTTKVLTITSTVTQTRDVAVPVTVPTTILSTITRDGSTQIITVHTTMLSTIVRDGSTQVVTIATTDRQTVLVTLAPSTVTLSASTITQPAVTIVSTITISGTISTTTIIQPASTVIFPPTVVTAPASTVTTTAIPASVPPAAPAPIPPPACYISGPTPTADPAGCNGRSCVITFDERAYVHWEVNSSLPALVTRVTFENPAKRQTCVTTSCNTELFTKSYSTSLTDCAFPPCPSNSINSDCTIVVGPIQLSDGGTTSVTQIGDSGWNVNIGPTASARDIGRCGPTGTECITSAPPFAFTPIAYTGSVTSTSIFNTVLGSSVVNYLLPQLPEYFPAGDLLGDCTTATLATPISTSPATLQARQNNRQVPFLTVGGSKDFVWPQAGSLTGDAKVVFDAGSTATVTVSATALSDMISSTAEPQVSATPSASPTASVQPASSSADSQSPANSAPTESTAVAASPTSTATDTPVGTQPDTATNAAPSSSPNPPADSTTVQVSTSTSFPTGTEGVTGVMTITETVYYSMLGNPEQQSQISELESLKSGISTFTGDLGSYVCGVLGCTFSGATVTGTVVGGGDATSSGASGGAQTTAVTATAPGAAARGRGLSGWMEFVPVLPVVVGVFG